MKIRMLSIMSLMLLLGTFCANAQATLSIEDFSIMPGETKKVSVNLDNSVEVRAFQVLLKLPECIKLVSRPIIDSGRSGEFIDQFGKKSAAVKSLSYKIRKNGDCMIIVNAEDAVPFSGKEGAVITLILKADEGAKEASTSIDLVDMEIVYADGTTYHHPTDNSVKVDVCNDATDIKAVLGRMEKPVDVYNLNGVAVKRNASAKELLNSLDRGVYVIDGIKVYKK